MVTHLSAEGKAHQAETHETRELPSLGVARESGLVASVLLALGRSLTKISSLVLVRGLMKHQVELSSLER